MSMSAFVSAFLACYAAHAQLGISAPEAGNPDRQPLLQRMLQERGLPFFDIRLSPDGAPLPGLARAIDTAQAGTAAARAAAMARLLALVPSARVEFSSVTGTPSSIRSTEQFLTGPANAAPAAIVMEFVAAFHDLL